MGLGIFIQLFRETSNKTVRDNAERYYGQWGFMVFDWGFRCFSDIEGNITNKSIYAFSFLVGKHREPQSINAKLFLPIIPIGIVAYALTLLWDNLCRNSCISKVTAKCVHLWVFEYADEQIGVIIINLSHLAATKNAGENYDQHKHN